MAEQPITDVNTLLDDLDAGVFREKIARALSDAAAGCVQHGKAAKVVLTFDLKQIADSRQVDMSHKLTYSIPTAKGKRGEENTTKTPLYVGARGKLSLFPDNQLKFELDKHQQESTERS